ncbi:MULTISPECIES: hypothetical protein [unclassified Colwellia]|jgi:hypothetical protein|uniref:hypothetical protein n=1 Tax=unclassified Colwellia TaxID=196834 RepID=UPI0015F5E9C5|nr:MULTISPECIES: hypothetical protein [unclassified Colwellia]MBA6380979.1 hypothetical protein [Colwellia sp. BRX10-7]MBA6388522.1 hypothetical protein [Colwellia sp. BRX10-2]MBA6402856.1 hypothetical protein [Colwellia sp. BRX10-5]MBA6407352.1 hypothetical protein [Colwellia sp. BRX10-1]
MKSLLFFILTIIQFNVSAGEISKVFGNGVFDTIWGQSVDDIKKVFPSAKEEHYGDITQLVVEDNRKVLGLNRDKNSKINFSFDSEKRLNGVAVYFNGDQFSLLLVKLNTLFGEYVKQGTTGVTYMQWKQDNSVTITLSAIPSSYSMDTIFSIGYYGLDKPDVSKDELGF